MKTVRSVILALLPLALAACGPKPASTTANSPTPAFTEEKKLNLYCWSEYIPQSVIDDFTKETGIKVSVENYSSNEEMVTKLLAGGGKYDLIQPSEYTIEALIRENQLLALNPASLSNLANISSEFRNMPYDAGNKFSVPYMAGFVGICVNTDKVKTPIKGFADVFTPAHKGRIVVLDDAREITSWAFAADKLDINDVTPENLEKVKPMLKKWLPLVRHIKKLIKQK